MGCKPSRALTGRRTTININELTEADTGQRWRLSVVVFGGAGVGKSSLIDRIVKRTNPDDENNDSQSSYYSDEPANTSRNPAWSISTASAAELAGPAAFSSQAADRQRISMPRPSVAHDEGPEQKRGLERSHSDPGLEATLAGPTVGVDLKVMPANALLDEGDVSQDDDRLIHFWDLSGLNKFRSLWPVHAMRADLAVLVLDPEEIMRTTKEALEELCDKFIRVMRKPNLIIVLNKIDLYTECNEVQRRHVKEVFDYLYETVLPKGPRRAMVSASTGAGCLEFRHELYNKFDLLKTPVGPQPKKIKLVMLGPPSAGKSTFLECLCRGEAPDNVIMTTSVDMRQVTVPRRRENVQLLIWDTAGQERFRATSANFVRGAHIVLLVFDVTSKNDINELAETWMQQVFDYCTIEPHVEVVGMKADLLPPGDVRRSKNARMYFSRDEPQKIQRFIQRVVGACF